MSVALAISMAGPAAGQTGSPPPAAASAPPSSADPFAVSGVKVDISGSNPTTIRDQAIREAQAKAWAELYRRLVPGGGNPPRLSDNDVARLVQGFEIDEEKVSASRYLGSITVRFRPNAVRDALGQGGGTAQYVEPPSRPFVLLPVTMTDGRTILWEDRTPWRAAWEARQPAASLVPLVVPDGELADAQAMGADDAVSGNADAVTRMAQRYKAGGVVVARTELPANGPDPARGLTVDVTRYGLDGAHESQTVQVKGGGTADDLLARAVASVSGQLDESWRAAHTTPTGPEQTTLVRVPLTAVNDWVETRKRLSAATAVSRTTLVSMSRTEALVNLTYRGGPDQLAQTLARNDLSLTRAAAAVPMQGAYPGAPVPAATDWQLTLLPRGMGASMPATPAALPATGNPSVLAPSAPLGTAPAYGAPPAGGAMTGAPPRNLGTLPAKGVP
ncbi:DUF2066 domain-containing protein [Azospirillum picis]|uniref:DUF2066 domain-containing protein n=1 Tax=Azospirillum picis TaxID=488438 RepID=A0ABU0MGN9_9PROT|nr:DUF2066 domain-containing protein [Azospirillum picis]MBP2298341.1 hypothetical protein [Azospirillum picis]MDQ0532610.1 hypothetical protein [Azospirillum picis]